MKILHQILTLIIFIFLSLTVILLLMGYQHYSVKSDSMQPSVKKYALVYVKKQKEIKKDDLNEGDIIAIQMGNTKVLHRVIALHDDYMVTKGDQNDSADGNISYSQAIGVMQFKLPVIGILFIYPITLIIIVTLYIGLTIYVSRKKGKDNA